MAAEDLVTRDGCPVEVYAELPTFGEPEWIHTVMRDGGSVLDLGAGVGRIADPLAALGHHVLAVDDSMEMLARVRRADTLVARIEALDIAERFDAVILASHLVNTPDAMLRTALLTTVQRHLKPDGLAFIEWHEPAWFDHISLGKHAAGQLGAVSSALTVAAFDGRILRASVEYELRGRRWIQPFVAERLSADEISDALTRVGLRMVTAGASRQDWITAESS